MSYKDLLVVLDSASDTRGRIELAASLAEKSAAHLVGLYPIPSPDLPRRAGYADLAALEPVYREWRERALEQAEAVREMFENAAKRHGISQEWRGVAEGPEADPALHARYSDLTILGQRDPDSDEMAMIRPHPERVTLASGRPILVIPYAGHFDKVSKLCSDRLECEPGSRSGSRRRDADAGRRRCRYRNVGRSAPGC